MTKIINSHQRADIYERVTASIVADLERGTRPWVKPWRTHTTGSVLRPLRHDGTPYRGINIVLLWSAATEHGYTSPTWMTYRQAHSLGGQVRKGETGSLVVFANRIERDDRDPDTGEHTTRVIPIMRGYTVFNADQIDGLPDRYRPTATPDTPDAHAVRIDRADRFAAATGITIRTGGTRACYIPALDHIEIPEYTRFNDTQTSTAAEAYYATLLHELTHATSPAHRCNRELGKRFGDRAYAREELVAELGAAFLCANLGITLEPRADHAAYIASWLAVLRSDKRAIFNAASLAQKAVDWLSKVVTAVDQSAA